MSSSINIQWLQQWLQVDWFLLAVSIAIVALSLLFSIRVRSRRQNQALNAKLQRLERELRAANSSSIGMGQQLIKMEKILKHSVSSEPTAPQVAAQNTIKNSVVQVSSANLEETANNRSVTHESSYNQARHYLSHGKTVEETVKACGLSYAEVSLLQALSKQTASIS